MKWCFPGHEHVVDVICDKSNHYYLWGMQETGRNFLQKFQQDINIIGILDSDKEKIGMEIDGFRVQDPKTVSFSSDDKVIITINTAEHKYSVVQYLLQIGMVENETYFHYVTAQRILNYYAHKLLFLEQTDLLITSACTLCCKDCLVRIPYIEKPQIYALDEIKQRIDLSFKFVDKFGEYHVLGGEPMLHPQLDKIIEYLMENYRSRLNKGCIVTNATILPTKKILDIFKRYDIEVIISDYSYSDGFHGKQKVKDWESMLEQQKISYVIREQKMWNPLGDVDEKNYSEHQLRDCFDYCDCGVTKTLIFQNDRVYLCARSADAEDVSRGVFAIGNSMKLDDPTEENRRRFLEYTMGFTENGYLEECKKCYLGKFNWEMRVPAARQIERKRL